MTTNVLFALVFCAAMIIAGLLTWFRLDLFWDMEEFSDRLGARRPEDVAMWTSRLRYLGLACAILGFIALIIILTGHSNLN